MLGTFPRMEQAKRVIIDIETYDPFLKDKGVSYIYGHGYILGIGIKLDNEPAQYYPLHHQGEGNFDIGKVAEYIHSIPDTADCVGHNFVYDVGWIKHEMEWMPVRPRCTMLASQLENNSYDAHSLKFLAEHHKIGIKMDVGSDTEMWKLPIATVAQRCCSDVELTAKLDDKLWEQRDSAAGKRENGLIPILVEMKRQGVKIDQERLWSLQKFYEQEMKKAAVEATVSDVWVVNKVLQLFNKLGIKDFPRTPKGTPSFPKWYLESFPKVPEIVALAKARELSKLIQFCVGVRQHIAVDGNIHPDFFNGRTEFGGTITGRFSCGNPNVQQIPHRTEHGKLLRSAFIPSSGYWFKFDYSQQEPRLMLHYASKLNLTGIQKWRDYYINPDADFYTHIQEAMQIDRFPAKTISLARSYNMGPDKLARMMHIGVAEAGQYLVGFDRTVPWLKELKVICQDKVHNRKWIQTLGGRRLYFNLTNESDSFNHLIQGSAADQIKEAMVRIYQQSRLAPILQVHDELAYDLGEAGEEDAKNIEQEMIHAFKLDFPTKVDVSVGQNWQECD